MSNVNISITTKSFLVVLLLVGLGLVYLGLRYNNLLSFYFGIAVICISFIFWFIVYYNKINNQPYVSMKYHPFSHAINNC